MVSCWYIHDLRLLLVVWLVDFLHLAMEAAAVALLPSLVVEGEEAAVEEAHSWLAKSRCLDLLALQC